MEHLFTQRDILSIDSFNREEILHILDLSAQLKTAPNPTLLQNTIVASCFFEPSTRTRLSFETAALRCGGNVIGFSNSQETSLKKGESLADTMRMIESYADVAIIRHPLEGSAQLAADTINIPVINGGDGANQHPTQTLLDLFTIKERHKTLDELHIAIAGDLKYGRTVHSLAKAFVHFPCRLYFIAPKSLEMPSAICGSLRQHGVKFSFHQNLEEVMPRLDVLYMTRVQKERMANSIDFAQAPPLRLQKQMLSQAKPHLQILHPLPRLEELPEEIDSTPHAAYFTQAENGIFVRQALLALVLGKIKEEALSC